MNRKVLIVAVEMFAVFQIWGKPEEVYDGLPFKACRYGAAHNPDGKAEDRNNPDCSGFDTYKPEPDDSDCCEPDPGDIIVIRSGPGIRAAAEAAELAISHFHADSLWNVGVAGGLSPEIRVGDICLVDRVMQWDAGGTCPWGLKNIKNVIELKKGRDALILADKSESTIGDAADNGPGILQGISCASGDSVVSLKEDRLALHRKTGASIVDMEGVAVAAAADRAGIPCFMIKGVSDDINTPESELTDSFRQTALKTFETACRLMRNA